MWTGQYNAKYHLYIEYKVNNACLHEVLSQSTNVHRLCNIIQEALIISLSEVHWNIPQFGKRHDHGTNTSTLFVILQIVHQ